MNTFFLEVNYLAVISCTFINMFIEVLWYSDVLFGKIWRKELRTSKKNIAVRDKKVGYVFNLLTSFLTVIILSILLHVQHVNTPLEGLLIGCMIAGIVLFVQGINYFYEKKSVRFYLLMLGYPVLSIVLISVILATS